MSAHTYLITLGFKAIYMPYYGKGGSIYPGHHGIDYATPTGTPVVISGKTIAYTGNTGLSSGPHLHVDKHISGSRVYSGYRSPSDFSTITGTVTFAGNAGSAGKMVVIRATNGHVYRFLHLSRIVVKEGDIIDMYKGKTAQEWEKAYTHALAVANTRSNRLRAIEKKYSDAGYGAVGDTESKIWLDLAKKINIVFKDLNAGHLKVSATAIDLSKAQLMIQTLKDTQNAKKADYEAVVARLEKQLAKAHPSETDYAWQDIIKIIINKLRK